MAEDFLTVSEEHHQQRLDVFLAQGLPQELSRTMVRKLIDAARVTVNGRKVKAHHKVSAGDEITVDLPQDIVEHSTLSPEDIPVTIFFEDPWLIVVNKPVGMLVHPVPGTYTGTLVNALLHHCQQLSPGSHPLRPGIVHRLDRETSGLLLVAKDTQTHVRLSRMFEKRRIKKKYVALVGGDVQFDEGLIDVPLSRHPLHFDKRAVSFEEGSRSATTFYRVMRRYGTKAAMLALLPESGRTHQLRVHMKYLGHTILGDDKYGQVDSFSRLALHAQAIGFIHPQTRRYIEFCSNLPREFLEYR